MRILLAKLMQERFPALATAQPLGSLPSQCVPLAKQGHECYEELFELSLDSVTGLLSRAFFMKQLMRNLQERMPALEQSGHIPTASELPLVVVGADVAFLNYFNTVSYSQGSAMLSRIGAIVAAELPTEMCCRFGGDEIAVYTFSGQAEIIDTVEVIQAKVAEEPLHHIDMALATLDDVHTILSLINLPKEMRTKWVVNVLFDVAMCRAQIAKHYTRLGLLVDLWRNDRDLYQEIIDYSRKGAGMVTDEEIANYASHPNGQELQGLFISHALEVRSNSLDRERDPIYAAAILQVAQLSFVRVG